MQAKIAAALDAGDERRAAYFTSTTVWEIMRGLWAAESRPMPSGGGVLAHLRDLERVPQEVKERLEVMLVGETRHRITAALALIEWILTMLKSPDDSG